MSIKLSLRLQTVVSFIPPRMHVADIGGDHAFLLLALAEKGLLYKGVVGELNQGPFEIARKNVEQAGFASKISVRHGYGLRVLDEKEVDVIVIAGMGGMLICQILNEGRQQLSHVKRLILQPNNRCFMVREWLESHDYRLIEESIVEENGKFYEILVVEPGKDSSLYNHPILTFEQLIFIGPNLLKKRHPLLKPKIEEELRKKKRVVVELQHSMKKNALCQHRKIQEEIHAWEGALKWLSEELI